MNSNVNFDPMTGQPIQNNNTELPTMPKIQPLLDQAQIQNEQQLNSSENSVSNLNNQATQIRNELQSIPTVEQNKQDFINNVQSMNQEKREEKKGGNNLIFIIIS